MNACRPYMKADYKSLGWMEGRQVRIRRWLWDMDEFRPAPEKAIIVKDYPKTVLVDLEYTGSEWGIQAPPRHFKHMITKAAMAVGSVVLIDDETGLKLIGQEIAEYRGKNEEAETLRVIRAEDY